MGSYHVALADLELAMLIRLASIHRNLPASAFWVMGLKLYTTTSGIQFFFNVGSFACSPNTFQMSYYSIHVVNILLLFCI